MRIRLRPRRHLSIVSVVFVAIVALQCLCLYWYWPRATGSTIESPSTGDLLGVQYRHDTVHSQMNATLLRWDGEFPTVKCSFRIRSNNNITTATARRHLASSFPTFILVGTQKGGTTAIHHLLAQHHSSVQSSKGTEPHFFDARGTVHVQKVQQAYQAYRQQQQHNDSSANDLIMAICEARYDYMTTYFPPPSADHADDSHGRTVVFEKTPSYMLYNYLPPIVRLICGPDTRIVVLLRNPVGRLHSSYNYKKLPPARQPRPGRRRPIRPVFDEFDIDVNEQIRILQRAGITRAPLLSNFTDAYYEHFVDETTSDNGLDIGLNDTRLVTFCTKYNFDFTIPQKAHLPQNQKGKKVTSSGLFRGMYALQLVHWINVFPLYTDSALPSLDPKDPSITAGQLLALKYEDFQRNPQIVLGDLLHFAGAPTMTFRESALSQRYGPNNNRDYHKTYKPPIAAATQLFLQLLYEPHNRLLVQLVGTHFDYNP